MKHVLSPSRCSLSGLLLISGLLLLFACGPAANTEKKAIPILGVEKVSETGDTVYRTLPDFALWDQDSSLITQAQVAGKIRVSEFFFTSCPTICPKMAQQMLRLHDSLLNEPRVILLSHTIDPVHDSVAVLHQYAGALGVNTAKWHLMTGDKDAIYDLAEAYMVSAGEDADSPGGYMHSGAFVLADAQRRIRGYYDGTSPEAVDELLRDIHQLLNGQ